MEPCLRPARRNSHSAPQGLQKSLNLTRSVPLTRVIGDRSAENVGAAETPVRFYSGEQKFCHGHKGIPLETFATSKISP